MKRILAVLIGLIAGGSGWQSFEAFHNSSFIENGTAAGIAFAVFAAGLLSIAAMLNMGGEP